MNRGTGLAGMVWLDLQLNPLPEVQFQANLTMFVVLILAATAVAGAMARRTLRIAAESARAAIEAERVGQNLGLILRDHHDIRTLLSSATLRADLLLERVRSEGMDTDLVQDAAGVQRELKRLNETVHRIHPRTYEELGAMSKRLPADPAPIFQAVAEEIRTRFHDVNLAVESEEGAEVLVAGGPQALESAMRSVLVNACEGSGEARASRVAVRTRMHSADVEIEVQDDGPGFPSSVLRGFGHEWRSTKADGGGYGLKLAWTVASSSDGCMRIRNAPDMGAVVTMTLPRARRCAGNHG